MLRSQSKGEALEGGIIHKGLLGMCSEKKGHRFEDDLGEKSQEEVNSAIRVPHVDFNAH